MLVVAAPVAAVLGSGGMGGCESLGVRLQSPFAGTGEPTMGPGKMTAADVQSEVMSFTDTFTGVMSQQWNQAAAVVSIEPTPDAAIPAAPTDAAPAPPAPAGPTPGAAAPHTPAHPKYGAADPATSVGPTDEPAPAAKRPPRDPNRARRAAHERKLATVSAALSIASSPNPIVSLADMITLVTLERMLLEDPSTEATFGPEAAAGLLSAYREQEEKVWRIGARAFTPEQQQALRGFIDVWRTEHPDQRYVSQVRLEDFALARQQSVLTKQEGGNLLSLVMLDPLKGLDPAAREVQKSRMLGERAFFYGSRMPTLLKWQTESLYEGLFRAPETREVLDSIVQVSQAVDRFTQTAERLPEDVAKVRKETLDQFFQGMTEQRKAILQDLDPAQEKLQGTLKDLRETVAATDALAAHLTTTFQAAESFVQRVDPPVDPSAAKRPEHDVLAEYRAAAAQTGDAADRLTVLAQKIDHLLTSSAPDQQAATVQGTVMNVQQSTQSVIDYAFRRLLILVLVAPFAAAVAAGLYRGATRRWRGAARGGAARA